MRYANNIITIFQINYLGQQIEIIISIRALIIKLSCAGIYTREIIMLCHETYRQLSE